MARGGPNILVVAGEAAERALIASTLREAGFTAVAAAEQNGARAALAGARFVAVVIALEGDEAMTGLDELRRCQPGLPALLVIDGAAIGWLEADCTSFVRRPFSARELLGCVFELVLREDDRPASLRHRRGELVAAAGVVCFPSFAGYLRAV